MRRSKALTVAIEPQVFQLMTEKIGEGKVSLYCYSAIIGKLIEDKHLTMEVLMAFMQEDGQPATTPTQEPDQHGTVIQVD